MKDYNKTLWEDNITLVDARKLNNIEEQVDSITDKILEVESNLNKNTDAIEQACTAVTGERFNSIDERIDSEIDRLNKKIDVSMLQQEYKKYHTIENSINGMTTDIIIKGKTIQNLIIGGKGTFEIDKNISESSRIKDFKTIYPLQKNKEYVGYLIVNSIENTESWLSIYGYKRGENGSIYGTKKNETRLGVVKFKWTPYYGDIDVFDTVGIYLESPDFNNGATASFSNFMLFEEGTDLSYVDDYFEGIVSIGEYEYNYLDESQISLGYIGGNNGIVYSIPSRDDGTRTAVIPCEPNTTYTITKEFLTDRFVVGTTSEKPINGMVVTKILDHGNKSETVKTPEDAKYLLVYLTLDVNQKPFGRVSITKGFCTNWTTPHKQTIRMLSCGKNLWNEKNMTGGEIVNFNGKRCYKFIDGPENFKLPLNCLEKTQYTISIEILRDEEYKEKRVNFNFCYSDGTVDSKVFPSNVNVSYTSISGKTLTSIQGAYNHNRPCYLNLETVILEEGTVKTDYEEHKGSLREINLDNYKHKGGLKSLNLNVYDELNSSKNMLIKRVEKVLIDENREFFIETQDENHISFYTTIQGMKPDKFYTDANAPRNSLSSKMPWIRRAWDVTDVESKGFEGYAVSNANSRLYIRVKKSNLSTPTIEGFKQLIRQWKESDNPFILYYELIEPVEIPIIEDINLKTFNNKTYITVENFAKNTISFKAPIDTKETLASLKKENEDIKAILNSILETLNKK